MKKILKSFLLLNIVLFCLFLVNLPVRSVNNAFETEDLSQEEKENIIQSLNISITQIEPPKKTIDCFDVNNGMIAVGHNDSNSKTVSVLEADGSFFVGYYFDCYGSFGVELRDHGVLIYLVRDQLIIEMSFEGDILNVERIMNSNDNNSYWNDVVFANKKHENNICYEIRNSNAFFDLLAVTHTQLVRTSPTGEENIIYDVSSTHNFYTVVTLVFVLLFVCCVIVCVILLCLKYKKNNVNDNKLNR